MSQSEKDIDVFAVAKKLAALQPEVDPNEWPHRNEILYEKDRPDIWALICLLVGTVTRDMIKIIWLLLEFINGYRRQNTLWDIKLAVDVLDEIKRRIIIRRIEAPSLTSRIETRFLELWGYQGGLVYHAAGEFIKAAECHETAADIAKEAGDERSEALERYMAAHERLFAALSSNENVTACYSTFQQACKAFQQILGPGEEDKRWRGNVYASQVLLAWIVNEEQPNLTKVDFLEGLTKEMHEAFIDSMIAIRAIRKLSAGELDDARTIVQQVRSKGEIDWRSCSMYIYIVIQLKLGNRTGAREKLQELLGFGETEHGGHLFRVLSQKLYHA